ncbi:MAG: class I tRNA ligase family protein [Candidatus Paceibacterota bacterium]|jgi:isoleucyl-tRNA synthetase
MEEKNQKSQSALREEEVLKFWEENEIFKKSLEKDAPKGKYIFYDGPPFASGLPHYGHILGSTVKDVIGRYKTMSGYNVPRRWGWDCHGLPIENIVEKDLGISGKKAIEALGIDKFTEHARSKVLTYVNEWKKTVDRMGRWVDFDNSYKTMDNTFIESVWWALGEMNKKGLLYEGVRVLAYCPRCETPIANSEIAMDNSYKDITDISVYVKFRIITDQHGLKTDKYKFLHQNKSENNQSVSENVPPIYLLAWTTTPWTLPGNTAIAINKELIYILVKNTTEKGEEVYIVAKNLYENLHNKFNNGEIIKEIKGEDLVGLSYEPVFPYYKNEEVAKNHNIWKVWHADFVTVDKGTGIAHEAPAFGEDDMDLAKEHNIPFIRHVEPNGDFSKEVIDFPNVKVKPKEDPQSTDVLIIKYLAHTGALFAKEKIIHSYPHCYRCETPLLYYALPSWFINIQKVKDSLLKNGEDMNWIPEHLKEGRFKNTMESAPDWTISRNRYWASPLPIWKSEGGKVMVVNSLEDLKSKTKKSGNRYFEMRHGEAECNISKVVMSDEEADKCKLTENGIKQVIESSKNFKEKVDIIISSPFERARETTKIICEQIGFPLDQVIYNELEQEWEISSIFTGKSRDAFEEYYCKRYKDNPFEVLPNSESYAQVINRVGRFIYDLENKYSGKNILIVGHAGETSALNHVIQGFSFETLPTDSHFPPYLKNAEIKEVNFVPLPHNKNYELDLHRPYVDSIVLVDDKGEEYKRIPEVIDCWFESGSMPFAQDHYPFENPDWQKENFPAGFVAEYIAQTRTWFYYTHAISTILFGKAPFENVVTTGTVLAEDGTKMSKSKNNFPDPWLLFDKYGVDALRFYLMASTLMKGEDVNFSEKLVQEVASKIISRFDNVVTFYELYRDKELENSKDKVESKNVLDQWILSRLNQFTLEVKNGMEIYDLSLATKPYELFIEDLSTWYLRRSRDRIKNGDIEAKQTLYYVLKTTLCLFAPFMPFIAEDIWQKLRFDNDPISIHLTNFFSNLEIKKINTEIIKEMGEVREVVTLGLQARQKAGIPVRQPLSMLYVTGYMLQEVYEEIIKDELNVKNLKYIKSEEKKVELDTNITEELKQEGNYRELVRAVQDMRKKNGLNPNDIISLEIATSDIGKEFINKWGNELLKAVGAKDLQIKDISGEKIKIDNLEFVINVVK